MDEKVKRLKTPKGCLQFAENVRDKKPELARQACRTNSWPTATGRRGAWTSIPKIPESTVFPSGLAGSA